jgi:hypothetical protein
MEKISIRPKSTEILIGNSSDAELSEVFSYDYAGVSGAGSSASLVSTRNPDEISKKLGSLYIVGHLSPKNDETSYIVSLIASLAKREYFANPDLGPKESFSKTLKKTNEVLQDFFKDKGNTVDIGIFAIANENIFISKLGKFKIFLSRDGQHIDVLNNIHLFTKDHAPEQEFSNVISGKVEDGDKILSYYPSRALATRERYLKEYLGKLDSGKFVEKMNEIKSQKDTFSIAALFIDVAKYTEKAVEVRAVPPEMKPKSPTKTSPAKKSPVTPLPSVAPAVLAKAHSKSIKVSEADVQSVPENVRVKEGVDRASDTLVLKSDYRPPVSSEFSAPLIIPSEFSSTKRRNPLVSGLRSAGSLVSHLINPRVRGTGAKLTVLVIVGALIIGTAYGTRTLWLNNSGNEVLDTALNDAEMNLQLANTKMSQNDSAGAREVLAASLANLLSHEPAESDERYTSVKDKINSELDQIDKASDANVSSIESLPQEIIDLNTSYATVDAAIANNDYKITEPVISRNLFDTNLYALTNSQIYRVADASKGSKVSAAWLKPDQIFPADPAFILVDGNIYVITKSGFLNTYYKGAKTSEIKIPVTITEDMVAMATVEGSHINLLDRKLGRLYLIDKKDGTLLKTLKINNSSPIATAHLANDSTVYISTQDSRFWSVK